MVSKYHENKGYNFKKNLIGYTRVDKKRKKIKRCKSGFWLAWKKGI